MKNKNGFTLIELLAVIVVLAIIMVIAGSNLIGTKKEANIAEAKKIEKMIEDLGPGIYSYEKLSGVKDKESYCEKILGDKYDFSNQMCGEKILNNEHQDYFYYNKDKILYISLEELYKAGYIKEVVKESNVFKGIKNPAGGEACTGYLEVSDNGTVYKAYLSCPNLYTTQGYVSAIVGNVKLTAEGNVK